MERVNSLNETTGKIVDFMIRIKRYNKTTYVIDGDVTFNSGDTETANHEVMN